jgi:hypothetical protein
MNGLINIALVNRQRLLDGWLYDPNFHKRIHIHIIGFSKQNKPVDGMDCDKYEIVADVYKGLKKPATTLYYGYYTNRQDVTVDHMINCAMRDNTTWEQLFQGMERVFL